MKDLKHIRRFNESDENLNISDVINSKLNELKKSDDGDLIESITIGELIELLSEYDKNDEISFAYNGDQGFIGIGRDGKILSKWNEDSKNWFLNLVYY